VADRGIEERAARDPEREQIRQLIEQQRRGDPTSAAGLARQRKIDAWIEAQTRRKAERWAAAQAVPLASEPDMMTDEGESNGTDGAPDIEA